MIPFDPFDHPDTDPPPTRAQALLALAILVVTAAGVIWFLWWATSRAVAAPATTAPASVIELSPMPTVVVVTAPPAVTIDGAATATEPALRVTTSTAAPVITCAMLVNGLTYVFGDLEPARQAYRETARCLGWSSSTSSAWEQFVVDDVIRHESKGCPNLRGGTDLSTTPNGRPCLAIKVDGTREDSGFGQLIGLWWRGPGTPVCDRLQLCTSNQIIASPWNSMTALLVAVETDGKHPWCYDARARRIHDACMWTPRSWSP